VALPDYFTDLDAMHEAEKAIPSEFDWARYRTLLKNDLHATAAQRAEAFGRTLNLWSSES
jgi:hypothetical protein